jgi:uncharacterized protein (DUF2249 family)
MTDFAATMNSLHKTLLFYVGQLPIGQYMTRVSRHYPNRLRLQIDEDKRETNQ